MRTKHFFGLGLVMGGLAAASFAATGCGGNGATAGTGGAGGAGSTSATTSSHTAAHTTASSVTSSSSGGAENPTCDTATDLALDGKDVPGSLPNPDTDYRWYKFDGKKGDPMLIFTTAKTGMDPFDTTYLDTVVTLYSGDCQNQVQVAEDDDPNPRFTNDGTIFTVLPDTATYYIRVAECNGLFPSGCAASSGITTFDFTVGAGVLDVTAKSNVKENAEPNDTIAAATDMTMKYEPGQNAGSYYVTNVFGVFDTMTDIDVYKVSMPMDITVDAATERSVGYFYPQGATSDQDGSTLPIGKVWIVDPKDPNKSVASIDLGKDNDVGREIAPPLKFATDYYLFVQRPAGMGGTNDFYILRHNGGGSNPVEKGDATNDDVATPEMLSSPASQPGAFFIDGDINKAGDVDYYALTIPANLTKNTIDVVCGGQRSGSGVRGLTIDVLKGSAGNGVIKSLTEDPKTDFQLPGVAIPNGETKLLLKMSAMSQDPTVSSTFYRCGIYFN